MKKKLLIIGSITTLTAPAVIAISCAEEQLPTLKSQSFGYVLNNQDEVASLLLHNSNSGRVGAAFLDINKVQGEVPTTGRIWTKTYELRDGQSNSMDKKDHLLEVLANDNAAIATELHKKHTTEHPAISWEEYMGALEYSFSINQENQSFTFSIYEHADQLKNELEEFADKFVSTMQKNPNTVLAEGYQFFKGVAIFDFDKFTSRYHMDANYSDINQFNTVIETATGFAPIEMHANNLTRTKYLAFGENHDITIIFHPVLDVANERFSVKLEFNKGGTVKIGSDDTIQNHDVNFPTVFKTVFIPDAFPSSTNPMTFDDAMEAKYRNALTKTQNWVFTNKGSLPTFAGQEPMLAPYISVVQTAANHFTTDVVADPLFIEQSFNDSCASSKIDMDAFLLNATNTRGQGLNFSMTSAGPNSLLAILESVMFVYENRDLIESTYARLHATP